MRYVEITTADGTAKIYEESRQILAATFAGVGAVSAQMLSLNDWIAVGGTIESGSIMLRRVVGTRYLPSGQGNGQPEPAAVDSETA